MPAFGEGPDPFRVEESASPDCARRDEEVPTPATPLESPAYVVCGRPSIVERQDGSGARKQAIAVRQGGQKSHLETCGRNCIQVCLEAFWL